MYVGSTGINGSVNEAFEVNLLQSAAKQIAPQLECQYILRRDSGWCRRKGETGLAGPPYSTVMCKSLTTC